MKIVKMKKHQKDNTRKVYPTLMSLIKRMEKFS